jgi:anti-anti-sigma factor
MSSPDPPTLDVEELTIGHRRVLVVAGEVDYASSPELRHAVDGAFDDGARELWIDLGAVEFIDSTGLHVMLDARARAHDLGRRIAVICPAGTVRRTFEYAGINGEFPLFASRDEAHRLA